MSASGPLGLSTVYDDAAAHHDFTEVSGKHIIRAVILSRNPESDVCYLVDFKDVEVADSGALTCEDLVDLSGQDSERVGPLVFRKWAECTSASVDPGDHRVFHPTDRLSALAGRVVYLSWRPF